MNDDIKWKVHRGAKLLFISCIRNTAPPGYFECFNPHMSSICLLVNHCFMRKPFFNSIFQGFLFFRSFMSSKAADLTRSISFFCCMSIAANVSRRCILTWRF